MCSIVHAQLTLLLTGKILRPGARQDEEALAAFLAAFGGGAAAGEIQGVNLLFMFFFAGPEQLEDDDVVPKVLKGSI